MLFYKIEGMLEGNTFSEDGGHPPAGGQGISGQAGALRQKAAGKVLPLHFPDPGWEDYPGGGEPGGVQHPGPVPGVFPGDRYRVSNLAAQEVTYGVLRSLLSCAERYGFLEDDQDVYEMFHLSELFHNTYNFDETLLPGCVSLEEQKRQTAKLLCQDAFDQELERIYQGPALLVGSGHPVHYLLVCGEGEARNRQVELLLSALYQNGRIHSQRATWKAYDYDDRVDRGPVGQPVPGLQRRGHGAELQPGGRRRRWPGLRRAGGSHGAVPGHPELSEPDPYRAVSLSRGGNREKTLLREPGPPDLCGAAGGRGGRGTGQGLLGKPGGERRSARRPGPVAGLEGGQGLPGRGIAPAF